MRTQKVLDAYEYYYGEPYRDAAAEEDYPVDMASVLDLGYGPISVERAEALAAEGKAEKVLENGLWRFRRVGSGTAAQTPAVGARIAERFG